MMQSQRTPAEQLLLDVTAAINARTLYGAGHPTHRGAVDRVVAHLAEHLRETGRDSLTWVIVGDELLLDQQPMRQESLFQRQFVHSLKRRGIERLTLGEGIAQEEVEAFAEAMSTGQTPVSTAHLIVGRVELGSVEGGDTSHKTGKTQGLTPDQMERARDAFTRFRRDRTIALAELEEVIAGLIESFSRSTRSMLPLAELKNHDEYTFIHSVNVSILVLAAARWHGFPAERLQSMGLAALLHDIGKLAVPLEVLNKPGKLEGEEWTMMTSHAEQGAWYLATNSNAPAMAVTVAYEHHLRFDGKPNYPIIETPRRPTLVSQMTSIADTFDAICTIRPYQRPLGKAAALEIIRKRAGTFYDPFLVANFEIMLRDDGLEV